MSTRPRLWRAFEDNEITHSGAHYLLAIASLGKLGDAPRAADVARRLGVTRAAASLQLRTLQEHGLVEIDDQQRLRPSPAGADLVGRVASKHEVLLVFLRELLGVGEDTAELDACKVEHLLSEETRGGAGAADPVHPLRTARGDRRFSRSSGAPPPTALRAHSASFAPKRACLLQGARDKVGA